MIKSLGFTSRDGRVWQQRLRGCPSAVKMHCRFRSFFLLLSFSVAPFSWAQKIASVFPLGAQRGSSTTLEIRGQGFDGVYAVWFATKGISGHIEKIEPIEAAPAKPGEDEDKVKQKWFRAVVELKIDPSVEIGKHMLRLMSPRGLSGGHPFVVTADPIILPSGNSAHSDPEHAQPLKIPTLLAGKLWTKGAVNFYSFEAVPGDEVEFQAVSNTGTPTNGDAFDAIQFTLYQPGGTWFDPHRPNRLATSDLPQHSYMFSKRGPYFLEVGAFSGISGPDVVYLLRIVNKRNDRPDATHLSADLPKLQKSNIEPIQLAFCRKLEGNRVEVLSARTVPIPAPEKRNVSNATLASAADKGGAANQGPTNHGSGNGAETIVRKPEGGGEVELSGPIVFEGAIDHPNKVDSYKLKIKSGQNLAFEMETPAATIPVFNPVVRLQGPDGQEAFNNIWFRVGPIKEARLKSLEPKVIYSFDHDGEYTLQIHDLTPRFGDPSFKYRILIRPQVPHVGKIEVKEDSINVSPGRAEKLTVTVEEEEGYSGTVALGFENLPSGVRGLTSTEVPPDPDTFLDKGKMGEFIPKKERAVLLVVCGPDAPLTTLPVIARLVARPVVGGVVGTPVWSHDIPVAVVKTEPSEKPGK
jgi:hypothetical protein